MVFNSCTQCYTECSAQTRVPVASAFTHGQRQHHNCIARAHACTDGRLSVHAERNFLHVQVTKETKFMHVQEMLNITDSQQQDMLYLRRLFYGKLGQLA